MVIIELSRCIVAVRIDKMLSFKLVSRGHCVVTFCPTVSSGCSSPVVRASSLKLSLDLTWSVPSGPR
jgi:hypothetical protein